MRVNIDTYVEFWTVDCNGWRHFACSTENSSRSKFDVFNIYT